MAAPLVPGDPRQLGDYWIYGRLGAGGQGVVYEAYDAAGERVAVKALHGDFTQHAVRRMARETEAVRQVAPFCTARVLASDLDATPPYIVSEYVPGPDLQQAVGSGGPFGPDELHRLAIGIATALTAIHRAGVVHRDLKPGNVLLGPDGPRVIDFGIARTEEMTRSRTGAKGTPRYMAPEVFKQERATAASDVWGWGAVVLFAAQGRAPFPGDTLPAVMNSVLHHDPDLDPLPEPLRSTVGTALAKDPAARPTAHEILLKLVGGGDETGLLNEGDRVAAGMSPPSPDTDRPLAETAEEAYGSLRPAAQEAVPQVLLRMVLPGEGADDTLRKAHSTELGDTEATHEVVQAFTEAGLLIQDGDTVSIANAALLRAWPRLRDWVDADRDGLSTQHALADAARLWDDHGRKPSDLYQGTTLERATRWAATGRMHLALNRLERSFLDAAAALAKRRNRQRGLLTATLAVLLVFAIAAVVVVVQQRQTTIRQRDAAIARRLATQSATLRTTDPRTSRRLALAAASINNDRETHAALLSANNQWEADLWTAPDISRGNTWTALSRDGRTLLTADKGTIRLWDVDTRRRMNVIHGVRSGTDQVALSPDGRTIAAVLMPTRGVRLWEVATGRPLGAPFAPGMSSVRFSRSGRLLMATTNKDTSTELWDVQRRTRILRWEDQAQGWDKDHAAGFDVSPDDRRVIISFGDRVEHWDVATRKKIEIEFPWRPVENEWAGAVTFSPDGRLWAVQVGQTIFVHDTASGEQVDRLEDAPVSGGPLNFDHNNRILMVGGGLFTLRETTHVPHRPYSLLESDHKGPHMRAKLGHGGCEHFRITPDDRTLRCLDLLGSVVSVDIEPFVRAAAWFPMDDDMSRVVISQDGRTGVVESRYLTEYRVIDLVRGGISPPFVINKGEELTVSVQEPVPLAVSRDGRLLAVTLNMAERKGARIDIWDTRRRIRVTSVVPPKGGTSGVAFSPDGKGMAITAFHGNPEGTRVMHYADVPTGKIIRTFGLPRSVALPGVAFTPDGRTVIAGGGSGSFEFPSGRALVRRPHEDLKTVWAVSPNGRTVLTNSVGEEVALWDAPAQQRNAQLPQLSGRLTAAAFSQDGGMVATGTGDGTIRLWETATARPIGLAITGHTHEVQGLAFTPDEKSLVSIGTDGRARLHSIVPEKIVPELCAKAGALTRDEWTRYVGQDIPYRDTCP